MKIGDVLIPMAHRWTDMRLRGIRCRVVELHERTFTVTWSDDDYLQQYEYHICNFPTSFQIDEVTIVTKILNQYL